MVTNGVWWSSSGEALIWSLMGFDGHLVEKLLYGH